MVGETGGVVTNLVKAADACNAAVLAEDDGVALAVEPLGCVGLAGITAGPGERARTRALCRFA